MASVFILCMCVFPRTQVCGRCTTQPGRGRRSLWRCCWNPAHLSTASQTKDRFLYTWQRSTATTTWWVTPVLSTNAQLKVEVQAGTWGCLYCADQPIISWFPCVLTAQHSHYRAIYHNAYVQLALVLKQQNGQSQKQTEFTVLSDCWHL